MGLLDSIRGLFGESGADPLARLDTPRWARVNGRVATPDVHRSPITGLVHAFGVVEIAERFPTTNGLDLIDGYHSLGGLTYGDELVVVTDGGHEVRLPAEGFAFIANVVKAADVTLATRHPSIDPIAARARPGTRVVVREYALDHATTVAVEGMFARELRPADGSYRTAPREGVVGVPPLVVRLSER